MQFDICLEMVFTSLPYEKRIEEIAKSGFKSVEFWFHDATFDGADCAASQPKCAETLKQVSESTGVGINNMVLNAPDGSFGGSPVDFADFNKYIDRLHEVIEFSKKAGINKAITCSGNNVSGLTSKQMRSNLEKALVEAANIAELNNYTLFLEPLNTYVDHEGYYLNSSDEAAEIVKAINKPSLKLLYDIYHMQIMEGNIISNITKKIDVIGHFHSAGVPGRHEIMDGELSYQTIIKHIDKLGYKGSFGLEYLPSLDSKESLDTTRKFLSEFM